MNIIYLHGFKSNSDSIKGRLLKQYCAEHLPDIKIHLPDLNMPPVEALKQMSELIEALEDVALVGSSLGSFYATQLVAKHNIPAVLINPAMRPWLLFRKLFAVESVPYPVTEHWTLDNAQLQQLEQLAIPFARHAEKILVLLQQGDEVLDYREAQRYYSAPAHSSLIMTEAHGSHGMDNFAEKLPMVLEFLSYSIK
ncbi:YqiA/YcfP family alpha/beta fold hydrolase [Acinetobacter radioresistens]|uniref:YqiA/YcfP family alpha/beta fold hydrolase n=1 Tax=Acinetobacter radioresistens TaxID=40216 RepID=UPI000E735C5C|nr:YqiA/YcfP family alpha/beta fold hydrolase [Acinetobacter radioresistens]RJL69064.1 esterase [Acinetobacter radioresistens]